MLRFKATLSELHHRIAKGTVEPNRRLTEVVMAMGYDHLANYFLGYLELELYQQPPQACLNVFSSIRRKVGTFVRQARDKLQSALASGAYKMHFCRDCSSQAFLYPKTVQRDFMQMPDIGGECLLCNFKGKIRLCKDCNAGFFPRHATEDAPEAEQERLCIACRLKSAGA